MTVYKGTVNSMGKAATEVNPFNDALTYLGGIFGFGLIGAILLGIGPFIPSATIFFIGGGALSLVISAIAQLLFIFNIVSGFKANLETNRSNGLIMVREFEMMKKLNESIEQLSSNLTYSLNQIKDFETSNNTILGSSNQCLLKSQQYICDRLAELLDEIKKDEAV